MLSPDRSILVSIHFNKVDMLSKLLKPKACLDEETTLWLFDTFAWALRNLDARVFYDETILVTPSNQHFESKIVEEEYMQLFGEFLFE